MKPERRRSAHISRYAAAATPTPTQPASFLPNLLDSFAAKGASASMGSTPANPTSESMSALLK